MRLLLFNPDTEYALSTGASFYTPPAVVAEMARERQLLPEMWARSDDFILVDNTDLSSSCRLVDWISLGGLFAEYPDIVIDPWGWNHALRRKLLDAGVPETSLPSVGYLDRLRSLAHRRTTIVLNSLWNQIVDEADRVPVPVELFTEEECMRFYSDNPGCWMKAPWSSSGRGVINTGADMQERHVRPWCHGIIRRQGSVMCETSVRRIADFATEWSIEWGVPSFLGLSYFTTSNRGKYVSNFKEPQEVIAERFMSICAFPLETLISLQRKILKDVLTGYNGLLGVDMIVDDTGSLRPFVEVNLRRTMGMLYL